MYEKICEIANNGGLDLLALFISFVIFLFYIYKRSYIISGYMVLPLILSSFVIRSYLIRGPLPAKNMNALSLISLFFAVVGIFVFLIEVFRRKKEWQLP